MKRERRHPTREDWLNIASGRWSFPRMAGMIVRPLADVDPATRCFSASSYRAQRSGCSSLTRTRHPLSTLMNYSKSLLAKGHH